MAATAQPTADEDKAPSIIPPKLLEREAECPEREELLDLIEKAGLTQSLLTYIKRNISQLEKLGAEANLLNTMRLQEFRQSFFPHTTKQVIDKLIEELAPHAQKQLDKFVAANGNDTDLKLIRYLSLLRLHQLDPSLPITGVRERARCMLACIAGGRDLVAAVFGLKLKDPEVRYDEILSLTALPIEHPEHALQSDQEPDLFVLVASCSVAIRLGDRMTARMLLQKVKQREQDMPREEAVYPQLLADYQKALPEYKYATRTVMNHGTEGYSNPEGLEVLALCNKVIPANENNQLSSAFSRVMAVREDEEDEWRGLTQRERERLFPSLGSIVHLEGKDFPQLPKYRSYSVWEVKKRNMEEALERKHRTTIYAHRKICEAHEALTLEHIASTEPAKAREWLRAMDFSEHADGEVVLRFADNLFIKSLQTNSLLIAENFNQRLQCWESLPLLHFREVGKFVYVGDLPASARHYSLRTPQLEIAQQLEQLSGYKTTEKEQFIAALNQLGSNQAVHARAVQIDPSKQQFSEEEMAQLVPLLAQTEEHRAQVSSSFENELSDQKRELAEQQQAYGQMQVIAQKIEAEIEKQEKLAGSLRSKIEARIESMLDKASASPDGLISTVLLHMIDQSQAKRRRGGDKQDRPRRGKGAA